MSATGNGYVIYMTIKRKTKLKPPEFMTVNLAVFDFGISGMASRVVWKVTILTQVDSLHRK